MELQDGNRGPSSLNVQVRFTTKQGQYAIPDYPFALEAHLGPNELNTVVNRILTDSSVLQIPKRFDFLVGGEFLHGSLEELILRHEALGLTQPQINKESTLSVEKIVEVEYVESCSPPEPKDCLMHDDWVSAVDASEKWILTGSYDNSLHLWDRKGKHKEAFVGHTGPIKGVCWVSLDTDSAVFASASQDQSMMIWEWDIPTNAISCKWICKGHERSVESIKADPGASMLATGSWNGILKIWSANVSIDKQNTHVLEPQTAAEIEPSERNISIRTPILSIGAHRECISRIEWTDSSELITSSWDHTIKTWDVELGGIKSEIAGQKAFLSMAYSSFNQILVTGSADRHIRIYDPRSNEGSIVKSTFTSHAGWVSFVEWSRTDENLFISGSHDKMMKLWDRRSPHAPLFNMIGHSEKILCGSWGIPKYMMSGGADNTLRLYNFNTREQHPLR